MLGPKYPDVARTWISLSWEFCPCLQHDTDTTLCPHSPVKLQMCQKPDKLQQTRVLILVETEGGKKIPATSAAESSAGQKSPDFSMEAAAYCDVQTELALEQPDRGKVTFQN